MRRCVSSTIAPRPPAVTSTALASRAPAVPFRPARWPRPWPLDERLLVVERHALVDGRVGDLDRLLRKGDVLVLNDAATLPASFRGRLAASEAALELRLVAELASGIFRAVVFGDGTWRTPTEHRPPPPSLREGDVLVFASLTARVAAIHGPRLIDVRFDREGDALAVALYRAGRPVQYAHAERELPLWAVQTRWGSRPWSFEMPSAGRPLAWELLFRLRAQGVAVCAVAHACGLSSTGDPSLDAQLPFPERYDIPDETVRTIERARARGGRVIAAGTSVVRALEGAAIAAGGRLRAGAGTTDLILDAAHRRTVTDGLLTGLHEPGSSHHLLLQAFCPEPFLGRALAHAAARGYLAHEFGDSCLILA